MKVAIVTPYYQESETILRRCIDSVRAQTHPEISHYMVADGFPRPDVVGDVEGVLPISLPIAHRDYGNTPRGVGAMCALNEGADIVCFLDADNLLQPNHVSSLIEVYQRSMDSGQPLDAVFAYRQIFLPGHPDLRLDDQEGLMHRHVDTSCISLARSAAFMWTTWGLIPRNWTPICDRVVFKLIQAYRLRCAWTGQPTVLYESNWSVHYRQAGLPVPEHGLHDDTTRNIVAPSMEELRAHLRIDIRM